MKNLAIILALFLTSQVYGQVALGEIIGEVYNVTKKELVFGAYVFVDANGSRFQASTDPDGRFRISGVPAGLHLVNIRVGADTLRNLETTVPMDGYVQMGRIIYQQPGDVTEYDAITIRANDPNRIKLEYGSLPVKEITAADLAHSPARFDIKGMVTGASSEVRMADDGELMFRGSRKGDMLYLIDGVKTSSIGSVPGSAIGRMQIYTGGLPAKYGDTMGGVIVLETKSYFDLYNAWKAEQIRNER